MTTQWGQFLDHDISRTPTEETEDCCLMPESENCFPIVIPRNDSFYSTLSTPQTCHKFSRSIAFCEDVSPVREQMNAITAFIDASSVYGSDSEMSTLLRSGTGGKLRVNSNSTAFDREMLPEIEGMLTAGDVRARDMPGLAAMHTLFLREHNRLADQIEERSLETLTDEDIFQLARRILVAEVQNIVYSEYLPAVLGETTMRKYGLNLPSNNGYTTYQNDVDPSIVNAFATAAYRFYVIGCGVVNHVLSQVWSLNDPGFDLNDVTNFWDAAVSVPVAGALQQHGEAFGATWAGHGRDSARLGQSTCSRNG